MRYSADGEFQVYYDWNGEPITQEQWMSPARFGSKRVRETTLANGFWISTVYMGIDHSYMPDEPPIIYETMAFTPDGRGGFDEMRYATLEQALIGHEIMVERIKRETGLWHRAHEILVWAVASLFEKEPLEKPWKSYP